MPSSYTQTGIELIATGEQSGTWGTTTNTNLQIIDRLTNGVGAIALSGTTHTLTTTDGVLSDGQYAVLVFGGSPSGTNTVTISPNDADHVYIVKNNSGQSVVLTQGSGGNVTVANGKSAIVYADGAGAGAAVVDLSLLRLFPLARYLLRTTCRMWRMLLRPALTLDLALVTTSPSLRWTLRRPAIFACKTRPAASMSRFRLRALSLPATR
jgi:hypothetical protein